MGAQVTAVCGTDKVSQVERLGADKVIDYTRENWREIDCMYDVVFDTTGDVSWNNAKHTLSQYGRMGLIVADLPTNISSVYTSL